MRRHPFVKKTHTVLQSLVRHIGQALPVWAAGFVLLVGIVSITSLSIDRAQEAMRLAYIDKGVALTQAFHRSLWGNRSHSHGIARLTPQEMAQYLLENMTDKEEVRFMAITNKEGTIVAHSDPKRIGKQLNIGDKGIDQSKMEKLNAKVDPQWFRKDIEGKKSFVVYRLAKPFIQKERGKNKNYKPKDKPEELILFVALDTVRFENSQSRHRSWILTLLSIIISASVLIMIALYTLQRMRSSRQSQRKAEALSKKLALTLSDGLLLFDCDGNIADFNSKAIELMQISEKSIGQKAREVLPPALHDLILDLEKTENLPTTELSFMRSDGERTIHAWGGRMTDPDMGHTGSMLLLRDMTNMRRLEKEVQQKEKLGALGKVAAGVAHELRNPLSSIKGYATYFAQLFPKDSEEQEAARLMVDEVERMGRSITELIGLASPSDIRPIWCDARIIAHEVLRLIQQDAHSRQVIVEYEAAPVLPEVFVDPDRMRQVFLNICLNALEAMPSGGRLSVKVQSEAFGEEAYVIVLFEDNGSGISEEEQGRVFDPYFTTKNQGTGLGLATVVKILESHKAQIELQSVEGQGTIFTIRLPILAHDENLLEEEPEQQETTWKSLSGRELFNKNRSDKPKQS